MHLIIFYTGVFFGMIFEGEMVMISSMIAAHHGYMNFWIVIVIGMVAIYCTDCFYFTLGRKKGKKWLNKNPKLKDKAAIIDRKLEKYPILIFIIYRFTFGLRSITPLVIGASKTKTRTFLLYSAMSITLWVTLYASIGYLFGAFIKSELSYIEHIEKYIIAFLILSGLILMFIFRLIKRRNLNKPSIPE
jgi:membrane protein DedA with SNARE-associated domain